MEFRELLTSFRTAADRSSTFWLKGLVEAREALFEDCSEEPKYFARSSVSSAALFAVVEKTRKQGHDLLSRRGSETDAFRLAIRFFMSSYFEGLLCSPVAMDAGTAVGQVRTESTS